MSYFWRLVLWYEKRKGIIPQFSEWGEHQGYRKATKLRWGLWELKMGRASWGMFKMWMPSYCEHHPVVMLATHTEPLETEDWTCKSEEVVI